MRSTTERVRRYVMQNPDIHRCLGRGVINFSALARTIPGVDSNEFEGAVMALRRLARRLEEKPVSSPRSFTTFLRRASIVVNSQIAILGVKRPDDLSDVVALQEELQQTRETCTLIVGHQLVTIVLSETHLSKARAKLKKSIVVEYSGLAQLTMLFPSVVMESVGFASYLSGLLAAQKINIYAEATCSGEHVFVVKEKDVPQALIALQ